MKMLKRKHIFILVHLFCWLIFAFGVLFSRPGQWTIDMPHEICARQFVLLGILMSVFYVNKYLLIPRLLLRKKVAVYVVTIVGIVVFFAFLNKLSARFFMNHQEAATGLVRSTMQRRNHGRIDTFVPGMILLMVGLGIAISFIQKWQEELQLRLRLEQEKVTTELTLLKAQINPHFFFNTLNTIYSFTLTNGDIARTAITNLSKMMRYVLYEAEGKQTFLSHEVAFISEYVALMRLRVTHKTTVEFNVQQQTTDVMLAPMLFLPFVENAFKHGVSNTSDSFIVIAIMQHDAEMVEFTVRNTLHERKRVSEEKGKGIGIQNTRRRLELLYPGKHELSAGEQKNGEFLVTLKLFL